MILVALAYIASALQIQTSFLSDPVGSKTVPDHRAPRSRRSAAAIMILRPDEEPDWPEACTLLSLCASRWSLLVGYAYALKPLGFLMPTAIAAAILSYQISPRPMPASLAGIGLSVGLFVLFRLVLGLGLRGFPRGWLA